MTILIWLIVVVSFLGIPFLTFIPYFAKVQLNVGESGLGWLMACSGLGAVLAAMTVASLGVLRHRGAHDPQRAGIGASDDADRFGRPDVQRGHQAGPECRYFISRAQLDRLAHFKPRSPLARSSSRRS